MPEFRRGSAAIEDAATRKGGGGRSFVPEIRFKEDGEKKYLLVLTPIDEVVTVDVHEFIEVGVWEKANGETSPRYEFFLSRKDASIGEDYDDLEDRLGNKPRTRCIGVAAELEPVFETVKGRKRPKGFVVKTDTYERKTENGTEEVTQPVLGILSQSSFLVWSPLSSLDESQGPLYELPVEVTRKGKDVNTRYDFVPFMDAPIDLQPILNHLDGISYIAGDGEVAAGIEESLSSGNELGVAQTVADAILTRRLTELSDKERYDELVGPIEELQQRYGGGGKGKKTQTRSTRPARKSPRQQTASEPSEPSESVTDPRWDRLKERLANTKGE